MCHLPHFISLPRSIFRPTPSIHVKGLVRKICEWLGAKPVFTTTQMCCQHNINDLEFDIMCESGYVVISTLTFDVKIYVLE